MIEAHMTNPEKLLSAMLDHLGNGGAAELTLALRRTLVARHGKEKAKATWDQADAIVRRESRALKNSAVLPKRARGRPKGTNKHADELKQDFWTISALDAAAAAREGRKPLSETAIANLIAEDVINNAGLPAEEETGGTVMGDDGVTRELVIVPDKPRGYYGEYPGPLARRLMKATRSGRKTGSKNSG